MHRVSWIWAVVLTAHIALVTLPARPTIRSTTTATAHAGGKPGTGNRPTTRTAGRARSDRRPRRRRPERHGRPEPLSHVDKPWS
jgi:hypothetical protein